MDLVSRLVQSFPNGGANAGRGYLGALAALLVTYPRQVATICCDPVRGVARDTRFLPTIADLVAWCERETQAMHHTIRRDDQVQAQLAARHSEAAPRTHRMTMDELRAKHGPNWGIATGCKRPQTREEARAELVAKIGQEAFDAIPDAGIPTDEWQKLRAPQAQGLAAE